MADYRLYYLDKDGRVSKAVECETDERAIDEASGHSAAHGMELWSLDRRVRVFKGESPSGRAPDSGEDVG